MSAALLAFALLFAPPVNKGLQFYPLEPCRALDVPIFSGYPQPFSPGSACGISPDAKIVVVNVTVSEPTLDGELVLDTFVQLSFVAGETVSNGALVKPTLPGIWISAGQARLQVDVAGYFQ